MMQTPKNSRQAANGSKPRSKALLHCAPHRTTDTYIMVLSVTQVTTHTSYLKNNHVDWRQKEGVCPSFCLSSPLTYADTQLVEHTS